MRKPLAVVIGILVMVGVAVVVTGGAESYQHIDNAYRLLERARYALEQGCHHPEGHLAAALRQADLAIDELALAIVAGYGTLPAIHESGAVNPARGLTPYVHGVVQQCDEARMELETAAYGFGGHRVKAIRHLDMAIAQLEQAVKYPTCR